MRALQIALVAATLTIPSAGYSEDQGLVGGRVGAGLEFLPSGATWLVLVEPLCGPPSSAAGTSRLRGRHGARPGRVA